MVKYFLMVLMSLVPWYGDKETTQERSDRMLIVAQSVEDASQRAMCEGHYDVDGCKKIWIGTKKDLGLLLITQGWWESRFAKHIMSGKCEKWECDPEKQKDGSIVHRAKWNWQVQYTGLVTGAEWKVPARPTFESTRIGAFIAAKALSRGMNSCKTTRGAISWYSGSRAGCNWSGSARRYVFYKKLLLVSDPANDTTKQAVND